MGILLSRLRNQRVKMRRIKLGFGFGHLGNDLVATMWFSYLLIFFNQVIKLDPLKSGALLLIGQLTDGLATPFIGHIVDTVSPCASINRKKFWHLIGQLLTIFSFAFIFIEPIGYDAKSWSIGSVFAYYIPFIVIFQVAWATIQISHLSMTGDLTRVDGERVWLNSIRNAFTVMASIAVHVTAMFMLEEKEEKEKEEKVEEIVDSKFQVDHEHSYAPIDEINGQNQTIPDYHLGWNDRATFRNLAIGSVALGLLATLVFHATIWTSDFEESERKKDEKSSTWRKWFKRAPFYSISMLYCLVRLAVNMLAAYLPFYLQETLQLEKKYISIVPLIQFISGFVVSLAMEPLSKLIGKVGTLILGCGLLLIANGIIQFAGSVPTVQLFVLAVALGAGTSTMLIQTLAIIAELVAQDESTSGFVYGFTSFVEKVVCGAVIMIIQLILDKLQNCNQHDHYMPWFYRLILGYGIGGVTILAALSGLLHMCLTKRTK